MLKAIATKKAPSSLAPPAAVVPEGRLFAFNFAGRRFKAVSTEVHVFTLATYIAIGAVSFASRPISLALLLSLTIAANVWSPKLGLALAVFVAPLQSLFGLHDTDFTVLRYMAVLCAAISAIADQPKDLASREPLTWVLAGFGVVLACHLVGSDSKEIVRELGWFAGISGLYLASLYARSTVSEKFVIPIYASVLLSGVVSALYLHGGMTWLIDQQVIRYENLRLSGVQYNPNVLSKLAGVAALATSLTFFRRPFANACLLPIFAAILYATGSKAAILGVLALLIFWTIWDFRHSLRGAKRTAVPLMVTLVFMTITQLATGLVDTRSASAPNTPTSLQGEVFRDFRIGTGYRMRIVHTTDGHQKIEYDKMTGIEETGQRIDLWKAGLRIMTNHWLWGLGPSGLTDAMMRQLDYPHTSPHNALLEIVDGYGLPGLLIYGLMIFALYRALRRKCGDDAPDFPVRLVGSALAFFLIVELVEPSITFAYGVVGLWFWHCAGLLASPATKAQPTRIAAPAHKQDMQRLGTPE